MSDESDVKWISGFWRRIVAFFIDSAILGIIGLLLGLVFEDVFVEIGGWGRLIGFTIALAYFGVMNSKIAAGQTIGKKFLELRVVNADNQPIDILRSFTRYCIIGVPFFLNGAPITNEAMRSYGIDFLFLFVIVGGSFSTFYLYVFNRITRQSLHDLAVGTYVVNANIERQKVGSIWKPHLLVVGALFIIAAILPAFIATLTQNESFEDLMATQAALVNDTSVKYATVGYGKSTFSTSSNERTTTTTYVNSQIVLKENSVSDVELARQLAAIFVSNYPDSKSKDVLHITLSYGFDIGIASQWFNHIYTFNPGEFYAIECESGNDSMGVSVVKNSNNPDFFFITELSDNFCEKEDRFTRCAITKNSKIRWGYGFCKQNEIALDDAINRSDINLCINEKIIDVNNIAMEYEEYERKDYPYCHTWLVELENWQHKNYKLQSFDGGKVTDTLEVTVDID